MSVDIAQQLSKQMSVLLPRDTLTDKELSICACRLFHHLFTGLTTYTVQRSHAGSVQGLMLADFANSLQLHHRIVTPSSGPQS